MAQHSRKMTIQSFVLFLKRNGYSDQTISAYRCIVDKFLSEHPKAIRYKYNDILTFLNELNRYDFKKATRMGKLTALKKFYDFLIETDQRDDHPCKSINVKIGSKRNIIQSDLFSMDELESLLEREERFEHLKAKNRLVISFLIYQGLLPGEIANIKMQHVDLDNAQVYVNAGRLLTGRKLPLMDKQVEWLSHYIDNDRQRLMLHEQHDFLLSNFYGLPEKVDGILYLIETMKPKFNDRNLTTKTIRDSVISYWVNEKNMPVEQVQLLAGHRWISSTMRYKRKDSVAQREMMNKFYPLSL